MTTTQGIDQAKLEAFVGKGISDFGAALSSALVVIGDKLGFYKAMAGAGPLSSAELAQRSGTTERYIRDWLINQAAGGYVEYDTSTDRYTLPDEHAVALTDETSPFFVGGAFQASIAVIKAEAKVAQAIRSGGGVLWGEQDAELFMGTERLWGPGYNANLVAQWLPAHTHYAFRTTLTLLMPVRYSRPSDDAAACGIALRSSRPALLGSAYPAAERSVLSTMRRCCQARRVVP